MSCFLYKREVIFMKPYIELLNRDQGIRKCEQRIKRFAQVAMNNPSSLIADMVGNADIARQYLFAHQDLKQVGFSRNMTITKVVFD